LEPELELDPELELESEDGELDELLPEENAPNDAAADDEVVVRSSSSLSLERS
jgi:hypothetical protein